MDTISKVCVTVIVVVALAGDFVLAWHGTLSGGQALGFAATTVGLALAGLGVSAVSKTVSTALLNTPPPGTVNVPLQSVQAEHIPGVTQVVPPNSNIVT